MNPKAERIAAQLEQAVKATIWVMDGEAIAETVVGQGPFVMNSRSEIQQAFEDYQLGRMGDICFRRPIVTG